MRWIVALLILVHGLIHFMGAAKGFGLAELRALTEPVSPREGVLWFASGLGVLGTAVLFLLAPRVWWAVGLAAVVLSQWAIATAWSDAKTGSIANLVLCVLILYGFASEGPFSLKAQYRHSVEQRLAETRSEEVITEDHLQHLPDAVQRYVRRAGAVGQPRVNHFRATWKGRIRARAEDDWMEFTAEQYNFIDRPGRYFSMDARRGRVPVDVLHVFEDASATMRVRLLSLVPLVKSEGAELTRSETVTLLQEISMLAPGALVDPAIRWVAISDREARALYTIGSNTISAVLIFDEVDQLIDVVSDDRLAASSDGSEFTRQRWSTPLSEYRDFSAWRVASHGEGWWHPEGVDPFAYIELQLIELHVNPGPA